MYRFCHHFSSCSESAEICHANSFCVKKRLCVFFFKLAEKYGQTSLSLSLCLQTMWDFVPWKTKTVCVCLTPFPPLEGRGGGGVYFHESVSSLVSETFIRELQGLDGQSAVLLLLLVHVFWQIFPRDCYQRFIKSSNWRPLCKEGECTDFVTISQVAQNLLKFAIPTLFVWQNVFVFFSSNWWRSMDKPLSLSLCLQTMWDFDPWKTKTVCVCLTPFPPLEGGSVLSWKCFKLCLPTYGKESMGTVFHMRRVSMPNFSGFWATWKIAMKPCMEPFNCWTVMSC